MISYPVIPSPQVFLACYSLATKLSSRSVSERLLAELWHIKKISVILKLEYYTSSNYSESMKVFLFVFQYCFQLSRIYSLLIWRKFCHYDLKGSETLYSFEADFCLSLPCDIHISMQSSNCPCCLSWVPEQSIYGGREVSVPRDSACVCGLICSSLSPWLV